MTSNTGRHTLDALRELAELQRESDRLRVATAARIAFEDVVARHDELQKTGTNLREFAEIREEAAPYLNGSKAVPPSVSSAELIAHARRRIEVFGRIAEAGIEGAAEGVAEAEVELAEELRKSPAEIELVSFGFLHGPAPEADLVVDMRRHFRDPHINPEMRQLTAEHELVMRTVFDTDGVPELARAILAAVESFRAGPSAGTVRVAVGCAGGRHRSAAMINYLATQYGAEARVTAEHRDIHRDVVKR
ncbi:RNase adapter RapZ [Streptomyces sp. H10-C2]|uniref:RapZ C-terminal domain-containing protein n=1 Tax=unclassified Streptomyces TaxID=2593676 RepID=UPI0024B97A03|nr:MULTISPECIES: RNase adapter RapZ [unclassified Streptomyces]MDJ0345548.1 RNase adapter RapZ [Streptomyces sp. PH10-H1]MDJ0374494.1 RNase adapter RapZ [Streptomyces sp. H10-C2]